MELKQNKLPAKYEEKTVPFELKSVTADGQFEGYAAIFGEPDTMNEVIEKGAFSKSLREGKTRPILWYHDSRQPIGVAELEEDSKGLKVRGQLNLEVQNAREKHALMKQKAIQGLSFGFKTVKDLWQGAVRILKEVKIYEISPVTFQAHPAALISAVKDAEADAEKKALKDELRIEIKKEIKEAMIESKPKTELEEINMLKRRGYDKASQYLAKQYTQEEWDVKSPLLKEAEKHFASMGWSGMPHDQVKALHERNRSQPGYSGPPPTSLTPGFEKKTTVDSEMSFLDSAGVEHKSKKIGEPLYEGEREDFNVGRILAAKITGDVRNLNDFERKSISEGVGGEGGWLLSEPVSAEIISLARNKMVIMKSGARSINMPSPELRLVRIIGDPEAMFRKENAEITESQWEIAPISLKAISCGCLVRASKEIISDAQNAGSLLKDAMAQAIALAMDLAGLTGDGVNTPRGIDNCAGVNEILMGANGAALTNFDEFSEACEDVANHNGIATAVIYSPRTHFALDRLKAATTNQPLTPPQSFKDLKKYHTNQVPITDTQGTAKNASKAYVGDFKNLLYGIRQQVQIDMSNSAEGAFKKVQMMIRATMRFDIAILRPSFCKISGIIPA